MTIGSQSSLWYGVVARGDLGRIVIGQRTNIQDGSVLHGGPDQGTFIGDEVTVGHNCVIHGARLLEGALIGNGSVILDGVVIGERAVVAAGSVVVAGEIVPERSLVGGTPASGPSDDNRPSNGEGPTGERRVLCPIGQAVPRWRCPASTPSTYRVEGTTWSNYGHCDERRGATGYGGGLEMSK